jgi:DNA-binding transcriptional MerR regulator
MIDHEAVIADAVNGETNRSIARRHGCSLKDVHEILDLRAAEVLTTHNRARVLTVELQRLDELHRVFHKHAVEMQDPACATVCVKISERKACLLGLNQPFRLDVSQLTDPQLQKSGTARIEEAIRGLLADGGTKSDPSAAH